MEIHLISLIIILIASNFGVQAYQCYSSFNASAVDNKQAPLYPLDTDGLSGRYTGYWSNTTGIEYGEITFQLWFLTYDAQNFFLSLVAIRNPTQRWDLYKPFILWTANRDQPVTENATLTFGGDGDFKLTDFGRVVWSTNTSNKGVSGLCVSNLGNINLYNSSGNIIWQSFDSPSDIFTIQVGMKRGVRVVSWASEKDPSPGAYSMVMEERRLAIYRNSEAYWDLEPLENDPVSHDNLFAAFCWQPSGIISVDLQNDTSIFDDEENFITGKSCASSRPIRRLELLHDAQNFTYGIVAKLTSTGDLIIYTWNTSSNYWYEAYKLSSNFSCFLPHQCGSYGVCSSATGQCTQICPETFNFDGACKATRLSLTDSCSSNQEDKTEMVKMPGMDYFSSNLSSHLQASSEEDCHGRCQTNCSCKAAFYKPGSCFHTFEDVQTLKTGSYSAALKVASFTQEEITSSRKKEHFLRVALPILVPSFVVLLLMLAWIIHVRRSKHKDDSDDERDEEGLELSLRHSMLERYSYKQLEKITSGFTTRLGQGGYGTVYKGVLENGVEVAVKRLQGSNQTAKDFSSEIASLARTHHLNLVRFLGFCAGGPKKRLLVYEFVPKGSLEKWIYESHDHASGDQAPGPMSTPGPILSWDQKYDIALGTARGMCYLHEECSQRIIHLDLKPENVLLDAGFTPKIADFGLSRLMNREVTYLQMTNMRGTPGYLAPEYMQIGTITEKSDVFSYGVLLLEIITGCRNIELRSQHLTETFWDAAGLDRIQAARMKRLQEVARLCLQDEPELRPAMSLVVNMMEGLVEMPEHTPLSNLRVFLAYRSRVSLPVFSSSSTGGFRFSSSSSGVNTSSTDESSTRPLLITSTLDCSEFCSKLISSFSRVVASILGKVTPFFL